MTDKIDWDEIKEEWENQFKDKFGRNEFQLSVPETKPDLLDELCQHGIKVNDFCTFCKDIYRTEKSLIEQRLEISIASPKLADEIFTEDPALKPIISEAGPAELPSGAFICEDTAPEKPIELEKHDSWNCQLCDGTLLVDCCDQISECSHEDDKIKCSCSCHELPEIPEEKELTEREKLDLMIENGEATRVSVRFTPGSTIHKEQCPYCKQVAVEVSHEIDGIDDIITLECGHTITKTVITPKTQADYEKIISHFGKKPYPFQIKGAVFLDSANGTALIADEMGLGKTIQACIWLKEHPEAWPFIIVTKASLKTNWYREIVDWIGDPRIHVIDSSTEIPVGSPYFIGAIISVDTLGRADWVECLEDHEEFKTVVVDECQTIKNMNAKRTKKVRDLCQGKAHKIFLSGTPIKNNAAEYFPVLNILRPTQFFGYQPFIYKWVDTYNEGYGTKVGGIKNYMLEDWKAVTSEFIIRRTRDEVNLDLPAINRTFQYHDLGGNVRAAYTQAFEDFMEASESSSADSWSNSLAAMSRMRHLTGIAKVEPCIEHVEDFLLMNPDRKLTIFAHHRDVIGTLSYKLGELLTKNGKNPPLVLTGETPSGIRQEMVDSFKDDPKNVILIASLLAAGEGLNLQFCSDCIILERQWNPANEEQGEGRFSRLGRTDDQPKSISSAYLVAIDTIDEFFARLVEKKRSYMASTLDGKEYNWDETSLMKELAEELRNSGRKPWMMQKNVKH